MSVVQKKKKQAKALLEARVHLPNENIVIFMAEMSHLFCHADLNIPEEKVCFLMRVLKQELFARLNLNLSKRVAKLFTEATATEKTLERGTRL